MQVMQWLFQVDLAETWIHNILPTLGDTLVTYKGMAARVQVGVLAAKESEWTDLTSRTQEVSMKRGILAGAGLMIT